MHTDPAFQKYRDQLSAADLVVFIYPIWWGRPPAILNGYFDQVFASDFAYKNIPGKSMPEGLLAGKRVVCISTMKGPSGYPFFMLGNAHKKLMRTAVFNYCGIKNVHFFEFGGMEKKNGKQSGCLEKVKKYLSSVKGQV